MLARILISMITIVTVATAGYFVTRSILTTDSCIQVDQSAFDFGTLFINSSAAEPAEHSFAITNVGTEALEIQAVRSTCGCTTADFDTNPIRPGETRTLVARLETREMGERDAQISVDFDNGDRVVLAVFANIMHDRHLAAAQPAVVVSEGRKNNTLTLLATGASSRHSEPPAIIGIEISDGFDAQFIDWKRISLPGSSANLLTRWHGRIQIRTTADATGAGTAVGQLRVHTQWGDVEVPVIAEHARSIQ